MSFNDIFKSSFLENVSEFSMIDTLLGLAAALVISLFIFVIYKKTLTGVMYSSSFALTLVGLSLVTTLVIMAVTSNVVPWHGRRFVHCPFPDCDQRAGGNCFFVLVSGVWNCNRGRHGSFGNDRFGDHWHSFTSVCQSENPFKPLYPCPKFTGRKSGRNRFGNLKTRRFTIYGKSQNYKCVRNRAYGRAPLTRRHDNIYQSDCGGVRSGTRNISQL